MLCRLLVRRITCGKLDANFTGHVTFYDLDDVFLGGFNFEKGKLVGYVQKVDGELGRWYGETKKNARVSNMSCGSIWECTNTVSYQVVYNPNGNNTCGPTATCQTATVITTNCRSTLTDCHVQWGSNYYVGDPTCIWYVDCSQEGQTPYIIELTAVDDFYYSVGDAISASEWDWIRIQAANDPTFLDWYKERYYSFDQQYTPDVSSADIDAWCVNHGVYVKNGVTITEPVRRSRRRGRVFEQAALKAINFTPNNHTFPSAERARQTSNQRRGVKPDGTIPTYAAPDGSYAVPDFVWGEAKCVNGQIGLATNESQILGFFDVLSKKKAELAAVSQGRASALERPILILLTTSDTRLSSDIVVKAIESGVRLFQMRAKLLGGDAQGDMYVGFGRVIPLNFLSEYAYLSKIRGGALQSGFIFPLEVPVDIDEADNDDDE
jgi:hypothetical protein